MTREEIEAACEIVRKYKTMRAKYPLPETLPRFVDHARAVLADAYLAERAERQRRIEAAAAALDAARVELDCIASPEARTAAMARIINKHMETT